MLWIVVAVLVVLAIGGGNGPCILYGDPDVPYGLPDPQNRC